ncbi:hypothetical protein WB91_06725 [bacteria symbiont BFo1 of Frankliniella occidentalis]|nr:hypothetical protein WB91_06725 [bacteria symbiont BFo1 of Frankliniella occidentalis]
MKDDIFEFDIDAQLEQAEANAEKKAAEVPADLGDEADCEGCKTHKKRVISLLAFFMSSVFNCLFVFNKCFTCR